MAERKKRAYVPKVGSAAYAVLVALYFDEFNGKEYWTKQEACDLAYPKWTNTEMIGNHPKQKAGAANRVAKNNFYDGWSGVQNGLIKNNELLDVINRKPSEGIMQKMYSLSEDGRETARKLVERDRLVASGPTNIPVPPPLPSVPSTASSNAFSSSCSSSSSTSSFGNVSGSASSSFENRVNNSSKVAACVDLTSDNEYEEEEEEEEEEDSASIPPLKKQKVSETFVGTKGVMVLGNPWAETEILDWSHCTSAPSWYSNHGTISSSSSSSSCASTGERLLFQEFDLILLVDKRELSHISRTLDTKKEVVCKSLVQIGITMDVEEKSLKVGDYMWVLRHKASKNELALDYIIERKSYSDLWSSITSKTGASSTVRYYEQKRRIIRTGISNRYYLVEGRVSDIVENSHTLKPAEEKMSTIMGSKVQSQLDGFLLIYSHNVADTIDKILSLTRQIALSMRGLRLSEYMNDPAYKKVDFQELQQKSSVLTRTVKQISESMIYQITGVGKVTAQQVFAKYNSMVELMDALEGGGGNVQSRSEFLSRETGLSKQRAKRIVQVLTTLY